MQREEEEVVRPRFLRVGARTWLGSTAPWGDETAWQRTGVGTALRLLVAMAVEARCCILACISETVFRPAR